VKACPGSPKPTTVLTAKHLSVAAFWAVVLDKDVNGDFAEAANLNSPVVLPQVPVVVGDTLVPSDVEVAFILVVQPSGRVVVLKFWIYGDVPKVTCPRIGILTMINIIPINLIFKKELFRLKTMEVKV